jgi:RNA recognition motif-containing protein
MTAASKPDFVSRMKAAAALRNRLFTAIVKGLPRHIDSRSLRDYFEPNGEVIEVDFVTSSKDYALITFANPKALADVLLEGDRIIDGSRTTIKAYDNRLGGGSPPRSTRSVIPSTKDPQPPPRSAGPPDWLQEHASAIPGHVLDQTYSINFDLPDTDWDILVGLRCVAIKDVENTSETEILLCKSSYLGHREVIIVGAIPNIYIAHMLIMRRYVDLFPSPLAGSKRNTDPNLRQPASKARRSA